jgi:hypothetical protein
VRALSDLESYYFHELDHSK